MRYLARYGKTPHPQFGKAIAAPGFVKLVMRLLSSGIRRRARARGIDSKGGRAKGKVVIEIK